MSGLSEADLRILAFERRGWRSSGVKEQAIAEVFGMSGTRYYQLLNELIDRPDVLAARPAPGAPPSRRGGVKGAGAAAGRPEGGAPPAAGRRPAPRPRTAAGQAGL